MNIDNLYFYINQKVLLRDDCDKICQAIDINQENNFLTSLNNGSNNGSNNDSNNGSNNGSNNELKTVIVSAIQNTFDKYLTYNKENNLGDRIYNLEKFPITKIHAIKMLQNDYNNKYNSLIKNEMHNNLDQTITIIMVLNCENVITVNGEEHVIAAGDIAIFPNIWSYLYTEKINNINNTNNYVYLLKIYTDEII